MNRQMQDAKLIKWLLLKSSFRGILAKQYYGVRSNNFTDFLDLRSRLWKVMKAYPREISIAALNPATNRGRRRDSPSRAALVLVHDITDSEKGLGRRFLFLRAAKRVQNRTGRHVAYDARLQEILTLSIAKRLKRKKVQYCIRRDDEARRCGCFRDGLHEHRVESL